MQSLIMVFTFSRIKIEIFITDILPNICMKNPTIFKSIRENAAQLQHFFFDVIIFKRNACNLLNYNCPGVTYGM